MAAISVIDIREAFNIAFAVAPAVMALLLIRYVWKQVVHANRNFTMSGGGSLLKRYWFIHNHLDWTVRAAGGFSLVFLAETFRSIFVWDILHYHRADATYFRWTAAFSVVLLIGITGLLCAIREFTPPIRRPPEPEKWWEKHRIWVPTLFVIIALTVLNFTVFDTEPTDDFSAPQSARQIKRW